MVRLENQNSQRNIMKKTTLIAGSAAILSSLFFITACSTSSSGSGGALTVAGKMTTGIGSSVDAIQSLGGAMGGVGTFSVHSASAATKCTEHADPGTDGHNGGPVDGVVDDTERYSQSEDNYALQKFYCILASDTNGPESVSGAVTQIKDIICAIEKTVGTLPFDNSTTTINSITFTTACMSQAKLDNFADDLGVPRGPSVTMDVSGVGGVQVTSALNPTFSEIPGNTHYSHGVKVQSVTPGALTYVVVAKFNPADADPIESGNFEFATYGTGTFMQGTAVDYTAGKVSGGAAVTKHLNFESRTNRIKSGINDPTCQPGSAASSCGFARHARISTDISFSGGDISSVSNMSGIMTDAGNDTGSGNSDHIEIITVNGSLSTGLTGKIYTKSADPVTLTAGTATLANTFAGGEIGTTTCIMSSGSPVSTSCGGSAAVLAPTGLIVPFLMTTNSSAWIANSSTKAGIGFSGAATFADEQFTNP